MIDFSFTIPGSDVLNQNWISTALFCPAKLRNGMRWRFMNAKTKLQGIAKTYVENEKPEPFEPGRKIKETFTVTAPCTVKYFDPVNFHPTEKVLVDVLVKEGILEDDNGLVIPSVVFKSGGSKGRGYEFRLEMEEEDITTPSPEGEEGVGAKKASLFSEGNEAQ